MPTMPKPLARQDYEALLAVLQAIQGGLLFGGIDQKFARYLTGKMGETRLIEPGASPGELRMTLEDLSERIIYALGPGRDSPPQPAPRLTSYILTFSEQAAAVACMAALAELNPASLRSHFEESSAEWIVLPGFPDLPPDPGHYARKEFLKKFARQFGGRCVGSQAGE